MAHYNPKAFMRSVSQTLLREYFSVEPATAPLATLCADETLDELWESWQRLPADARDTAEGDFEAVHLLADEIGMTCILDESKYWRIDLSAITGHESVQDRAMWVLINHREIIRGAARFRHVDALAGKPWVTWKQMPKGPIDVPIGRGEKLAQEVGDFFFAAEGRGRLHHVERFLRNERAHYVFIYLDDFASRRPFFDSSAQFSTILQRTAFEVIFHYDFVDGILSVLAPGSAKTKEHFRDLFVTIVLGSSEQNDPFRPTYRLDHLKDATFQFVTDPEDAVEEVRIRQLRLSPLGDRNEQVTLKAGGRNRDHIYKMLERYVRRERFSLDDVTVTQATLQFTLPPGGNGRVNRQSFSISTPKSCNLKSKPESLRKLGEKYLRRWGIDVD